MVVAEDLDQTAKPRKERKGKKEPKQPKQPKDKPLLGQSQESQASEAHDALQQQDSEPASSSMEPASSSLQDWDDDGYGEHEFNEDLHYEGDEGDYQYDDFWDDAEYAEHPEWPMEDHEAQEGSEKALQYDVSHGAPPLEGPVQHDDDPVGSQTESPERPHPRPSRQSVRSTLPDHRRHSEQQRLPPFEEALTRTSARMLNFNSTGMSATSTQASTVGHIISDFSKGGASTRKSNLSVAFAPDWGPGRRGSWNSMSATSTRASTVGHISSDISKGPEVGKQISMADMSTCASATPFAISNSEFSQVGKPMNTSSTQSDTVRGEPEMATPVGTGLDVDNSIEVGIDVMNAQKDFQRRGAHRWKDKLPGSFLTYGWVLLINTFLRQFALQYCVVMTTDFPIFGSCGQSIVFMANFALLINLQPYQAQLLNIQETVLIGCMAVLTMGGSFNELLIDHESADDYAVIISRVGTIIDVLVIVILIIVGLTVLYNVQMVMKALSKKEKPSDALNSFQFNRVLAMEKAKSDQTTRRLRRVLLEGAEDLTTSGAPSVETILSQVKWLQQSSQLNKVQCRTMDTLVSKVLSPYVPAAQLERLHNNTRPEAKKAPTKKRQLRFKLS